MFGRLACVVALALVGCASPVKNTSAPPPGRDSWFGLPALEPATCGSIERLHVYDDVYLSSQPSPDDLAALARLGVTTVINLRHAAEVPEFDEAKIAAGLGLTYIHVPWNGAQELTDDVFAEIRYLLKTVERPALVHCGSGNRVGAVWLPWRILDCGLAWDDALAEAQRVGLTSSEYEAKAHEYIERKYDAY